MHLAASLIQDSIVIDFCQLSRTGFRVSHQSHCWLAVVFAVMASTTPSAVGESGLPDAAVCRLGESGDSNWSHGVYATTFSLDGKLAATRSSDQIIRFWDVSSGQKLRELPEYENGRIKDFAFSHDGKYLATAIDADEPAPTLWLVDTGKAVPTGRLPANFLVRRGEVQGEFLHIARHSVARRSVDDPSTSIDVRGLPNAGAKAEPITISHDQRELILQEFPANGVRVRLPQPLYNLQIISLDGSRPFRLSPFEKPVTHAIWSPNGIDVVVSCRDDRRVHFRNTTQPLLKIARGGHAGVVQDLTISPDGRHLVSAAVDGKFRIWEMLTKSVVVEIDEGEERRLVSANFSPDGRFLATGSAGKTDNSAIVWDWKRLLLSSFKYDEAESIEGLWSALVAVDPKPAYAAMMELIRHPQATQMLNRKFGGEIGELTREEIGQLIAQLNDPVFATRESAHEKLLRVRITAAEQLRAALESGLAPVETEVRLGKLLLSGSSDEEMGEDQTRQLLRAVYVLELIGSRETRETLTSIAKAHPFDIIRTAAKETVGRWESTDAR